MNLRDMMADDAKDIFFDREGLAEPSVYTFADGSRKDIDIIVHREEREDVQNQGVKLNSVRVWIHRDDLPHKPDPGSDTIRVAVDPGDTPTDRHFVNPIEDGPGRWRVEVQ